nr:nucleotide-binding alpha-beta plait domain-containing protein [Tanacetum cinerariifolium]
MFSIYGNVVNVYIAFKRTKKGTRFGFVRVINVGDAVTFERRLKVILIGSMPLVINWLSSLKWVAMTPDSEFPPMNPGVPPKPKPSKPAFNFSFKDAVAVSNRDNRVKISIEEYGFTMSKLDCCLTRKAENLQSKDFALKTNVGSINGSDDIKPWEETVELHGRLTWMVIDGIPILGRNIVAVKAIAGRFDGLLEVVRLNFDYKIISIVKALILTYNMREVGQLIDVVLNNKSDPVGYLRNRLCCLVSSTTISIWDDKSTEGSMFEEEVIDPSLEAQDGGGSLSAKRIQEYGNTKSPLVIMKISTWTLRLVVTEKRRKKLVVRDFTLDMLNSQRSMNGLDDEEVTKFISGNIGYYFKPIDSKDSTRSS